MRSTLATLSLAVLLGAAPAAAQTKPTTPAKKPPVAATTQPPAVTPSQGDSTMKTKKHSGKKHSAKTHKPASPAN